MYTLTEKEKTLVLELVELMKKNDIDEMQFLISCKRFELYRYIDFTELSLIDLSVFAAERTHCYKIQGSQLLPPKEV